MPPPELGRARSADGVVDDGADQRLAVAEHERVRIDSGAEVDDAERGSSACWPKNAARDQAEQRLEVVDPRAEYVGAAEERAAREEIAAQLTAT